MSISIQSAKKPTRRIPRIVLNADDLTHLEGLADGMMKRQPAVAGRLLDEIGRARIVPSSKLPRDVVSMGSTVTYRDESTGQEKSVTLVCPEEADITNMRVSVMTPIGVALLGLAEGVSFYWDTRDNQRRILTVRSVNQPSSEH